MVIGVIERIQPMKENTFMTYFAKERDCETECTSKKISFFDH